MKLDFLEKLNDNHGSLLAKSIICVGVKNRAAQFNRYAMSEFILSILSSIGWSTVLLGLFGWIGKMYLDKTLQNERKKHQEELAHLQSKISKDLELHKHQLKFDERFFDHLYRASMDLFKIRQFVIPDKTYPDMEWPDALEKIAMKFEEIKEKLTKFIEKYYTALPPEIIEPLNFAIGNCTEGAFTENPNEELDTAEEVYNSINETCKKLKSIVDEKRQVEISTLFKE